jgi:alcohol dehydrogenase/propanol-preferring alcohol dehydrogenase
MATMKAAVVPEPKGAIQIVEREVPQPERGQVLVKVHACGICHSDVLTKEGLWPGLQFPRVPGHEIAGAIEALGPDVEGWSPGERVGVGWYGGHCGRCEACRAGDFIMCERARMPGISYDGGYAEYMVAPVDALARIPQDLSDVEAAPLLCAGITTFNALRNSGARAGDTVAILGIGGLGHLGVQYAAKMGFRTVAIARGQDKAALAKKLGAHEYIDSQAGDPGAALKALGGARVILATVTNGQAMSAVIPGLARNGKLLIVGAAFEPVQVPPVAMIMTRGSVQGWPSGTAADSTDTLAFSALANVRPMIEEYPLEQAAQAYDRMMSGAARFRVVLKMG